MTSSYIFMIASWLIVAILAAALFALILYWLAFNTLPPFIPVAYEILPKIYKALGLGDNSVLYDLGSGDCRVIMQCYVKNPRAKYIGVDKKLFPTLLARLRMSKFSRKANIKILRQDLFKTDLSNASHVFAYLFPNVMAELTKKLEAELRPGSRVVCLDFPLHRPASSTIDLERPYTKLGQTLYIYDF